MPVLLSFATTLFVAVLISGWAHKTVLSTSVLFLAAGLLAGSHWFPGAQVPSEAVLQRVAEIALFTVLFSDGLRTGGVGEFRRCWRLPGRALLVGMPLTALGIAGVTHWLAGLPWRPSFLFGAVLSPTDPVFVSSVFSIEGFPKRLKDLLNLESGVNDGLALPAVLFLSTAHRPDAGILLLELAGGAILGSAIAWVSVKVESTPIFSAVGIFEPLMAFSIALLVMAVAYATGANLFLAAFTAGITVAGVGHKARISFERFGEIIAELFKLLALLLLGMAAAPRLFTPLKWQEFAAIAVAVFAVRPFAIYLSLLKSRLPNDERWLAGWFGPKGFASVVYGIMIMPTDPHLAHMVGLGVIASIVVFSSTDILVGRRYENKLNSDQRKSEVRQAA